MKWVKSIVFGLHLVHLIFWLTKLDSWDCCFNCFWPFIASWSIHENLNNHWPLNFNLNSSQLTLQRSSTVPRASLKLFSFSAIKTIFVLQLKGKERRRTSREWMIIWVLSSVPPKKIKKINQRACTARCSHLFPRCFQLHWRMKSRRE